MPCQDDFPPSNEGPRQDFVRMRKRLNEATRLRKAKKEVAKAAYKYYKSVLPLMLKGATKKEAAFWTVFIQRVQVRVGLKGACVNGKGK